MEQSNKIHPYKITLWVAIGSIIMMFAGLTSAYIVKRNQTNWQGFDLPVIFMYSTAVIIASSVAMQLALRSFRLRHRAAYRQFLVLAALLGLVFIGMQWSGFVALQDRGIKLVGRGSNVAGSFLAVIAGVHMMHVLGGIVAVAVMLFRDFRARVRSYSPVPVEVAVTYWHFVDLLWVYLFVFLNWVS